MSHPQPPAAAVRAARQGLEQLNRQEAAGGVPRTLQVRDSSLVAPHEVFTASLTDAADGAFVAQAQSAGWRFLVADAEGGPVAAVEVEPTRSDASPSGGGGETDYRFSSVNRGPFVSATATAFSRVLDTGDGGGGGGGQPSAVEIRLLRLPAVYLQSAWRVGGGSAERFVPLEPVPAGIEERAYTREELERAVMPLARRRLEEHRIEEERLQRRR